MKITVVVPTYRRTKDLQVCLAFLTKQVRPMDELWVIVRDTDTQTWDFLKNLQPALQALPLHTATVTASGVIAAMNVGLQAATGDIVVFTDDDSGAHPHWLERIEQVFLADPQVGGVGGRDWVYHGTELEAGAKPIVGKLQWFGRMIGNHHIGIGGAREVDFLKGVNMGFRREAIADPRFEPMRFDPRMRGTGAQVHFEVIFCLAMRQRGWKLIYDSEIGVDHFRGERFDEDKRDSFNPVAVTNAVHNESLAVLDYLSDWQRFVFGIWAIAVGTRDSFGLVQCLRFLPHQRQTAIQKLWASWQGRWQGWQTWQAGRTASKGG
jgi:glycosyltransferase involved in cell wall biosynthesis